MRSESPAAPSPAASDLGPVVWVIRGDERDGVVRHPREVAAHLRGVVVVDAVCARAVEPTSGLARAATGCSAVVVTYVDRLHPAGDGELSAWVHSVRKLTGAPIVAWLHDIPQPGEGALRRADRIARYRELADAVDCSVVATRHEKSGLAAISTGRSAIVPLHLPDRPRRRSHGLRSPADTSQRPEREVVVLGHLHPGKAVDLVMDALTDVDPSVDVRILGDVVPGHEADAAALADRAVAQARRFRVTGWRSDHKLDVDLASAGVPVAWYRHISASASVLRWIAAGRRPIVPADAHGAELADRFPGCVRPTPPDSASLADAVAEHLADPALTWHDHHLNGHGTDRAAEALRSLLASLQPLRLTRSAR